MKKTDIVYTSYLALTSLKLLDDDDDDDDDDE